MVWPMTAAAIWWEGLVCLQQTGKCTDAHRELVRNWLEKKNLADIQVTELFDVCGTKYHHWR